MKHAHRNVWMSSSNVMIIMGYFKHIFAILIFSIWRKRHTLSALDYKVNRWSYSEKKSFYLFKMLKIIRSFRFFMSLLCTSITLHAKRSHSKVVRQGRTNEKKKTLSLKMLSFIYNLCETYDIAMAQSKCVRRSRKKNPSSNASSFFSVFWQFNGFFPSFSGISLKTSNFIHFNLLELSL